MTSAPSPFESLPSDCEAASRPARWMEVAGKRRGLIPSFYEPHSNLSLIVKTYEGLPVLSNARREVAIGEVMPERRWAIDDQGRVLRQDLFERKMRIVYQENFELSAKDGGSDNKPRIPSLEYHHYPEVVAWILKQPDPADPTRTVPMHYDATPKAPVIPQAFVDASGETVEGSAEEHIVAAYRNPTLRKTLKPHEVVRAEEILGGAQPSREAELEKQVAALLDRTTELEKRLEKPLTPAVPAALHTASAACGKEFTKPTPARAKQAVSMHVRSCNKCKVEAA